MSRKYPLIKKILKVEAFDIYLYEYPLLIRKIIECSIEANKAINPKLFNDCIEFKPLFGMQNDDFAKNKFTLVIESHHTNNQKAPT